MKKFNTYLLKATIEAIQPVAEQFSTEFYRNLFEILPQTRPLFASSDFEKQKSMLLKSLTFIVNNLDDWEHIKKYLNSLGARHFEYGADETHYPVVGDALLSTFRQFFKENWNSDLEEAWQSAYQTVSELMLQGAREALQKACLKQDSNTKPRPDFLNSTATPEVSRTADSWTAKIINSLVERILAHDKFKSALREDARTAMRELQFSENVNSEFQTNEIK